MSNKAVNAIDADRSSYATRSTSVCEDGTNQSGDRFYSDARPSDVAAPFLDDGRREIDARSSNAVVALCAELREHYRVRVDMLNAERRATLQIKSVCRRIAQDTQEGQKLFKAVTKNEPHPLYLIAAGNIAPLLEARQPVRDEKNRREKTILKLVQELPALNVVDDVAGFGRLGYGMIIAESGPLTNYANPAKLWKRFGLAVINGQRQRRVAGAEALVHGYSTERRALMYNVGEAICRRENEYRTLRDERKQYEREKAEAEGLIIAPAGKIPPNERHLYRSVGHIHDRANRYMQKRLLKNLWREWREI